MHSMKKSHNESIAKFKEEDIQQKDEYYKEKAGNEN